jgi:hypothetical protein
MTYQNGENIYQITIKYTKWQIYKIAVKHTKCTFNLQTYSIARPSLIYQNREFLVRNMSSGNPALFGLSFTIGSLLKML